jgi:two-component system, response regulator
MITFSDAGSAGGALRRAESWRNLTINYIESGVTAPAILLVDDSPTDSALILRALAPIVGPDQVAVCADGMAALDFLFCRGAHAGRNPCELPQIVLLDLNLPRVSGFDVLREVRANERTRLLPVTILSGAANPEDVRKAIKLGANSFIRKPDDYPELSRRVAVLARYWLELNIPITPTERRSQ